MSSFVFYRFKSQKEPSRISFDGQSISVWDLKKEIIMENKMGKGGDFDFAIYREDTEEEYYDDHAMVPRATSVLARRLPPSKPGRGNAQNYMPQLAGEAASASGGRQGNGYQGGGNGGGGGGGQAWKPGAVMSKRFDGKDDSSSGAIQEPIQVVVPADAQGDEASALAAMFAASSQQWQQTQEQMASATPIHRAPMRQAPRPAAVARPHSATFVDGVATNGSSGGPAASAAPEPGRSSSMAHKPTPAGYICYRCGQKGHWIQDCPTNSDRSLDDRPRIKRTTGIPKSFLQTVEGPGGEVPPTGVMVTAEGGFVIAKPDQEAWNAHRSITKNLSAKDIQNLAPTDPDLTCPICSRLLKDATLSPCCSTSFCHDCLHNALVDNDMLCPECESRVKNLGKLVVDKGRRERVATYILEMVEASKEEVVEEEQVVEEVVKKEEETEENAVAPVEVSGNAEPSVDSNEIQVKTEESSEVLVPVKVEESTVGIAEGSASPNQNVPSTTTSPPASAVADNGTPPHNPNVALPVPFARPPVIAANAIQQAQILRQQQLQQQRALAMQNGFGMGMNPQMLQQQMYSMQMALQNPHLHPHMRMNILGQLQQMQAMAIQMGLVPNPGGTRMGGAIAQAYGGNLANRMRPTQTAMVAPQQPIPTGPRFSSSVVEEEGERLAAEAAAGNGGVSGQKRARDVLEVAPEAPAEKKPTLSET